MRFTLRKHLTHHVVKYGFHIVYCIRLIFNHRGKASGTDELNHQKHALI